MFDTAAIFCGSRLFSDSDKIQLDLEKLDRNSYILVGGAKGADTIAESIAFSMGFATLERVQADWNRYGRGAGFRRNASMLRKLLECDARTRIVYAYYKADASNTGTEMMVRIAREAGVEICRRVQA